MVTPSMGTLWMVSNGAESLRQDGHDDKRKTLRASFFISLKWGCLAPHLFSWSIWAAVIFSSFVTYRWTLGSHHQSVTAADGSTILWWMQTNIKCLPSRPAHLIEMQLVCVCQYKHMLGVSISPLGFNIYRGTTILVPVLSCLNNGNIFKLLLSLNSFCKSKCHAICDFPFLGAFWEINNVGMQPVTSVNG